MLINHNIYLGSPHLSSIDAKLQELIEDETVQVRKALLIIFYFNL